jgi:hypothetical protein
VNASFARMTLLAALGACSFAAAAQSAAGVGVSVETGTSEAVADDRVNADEAAIDRTCLRSTGTRIAPRARTADGAIDANGKRPRCVSANGRVYTREDLDSTGAVNVAEALRLLDPAIR